MDQNKIINQNVVPKKVRKTSLNFTLKRKKKIIDEGKIRNQRKMD